MKCISLVIVLVGSIFLYLSKGQTAKPNNKGNIVPIVFHYADDAKRIALKRQQGIKAVNQLKAHGGFTLQVVVHDAVLHQPGSSHNQEQHLEAALNSTVDYIQEEDDPVYRARRVKRWGHHHHGYHHHHHGYHHHHHKPVSLDFGCNSDNFHEHLTKQHDASDSSDGITSAPSTSSSSDDHQPLSLFIKRPHHYHRPHHHGPSITFRCNAHNHHIFKHFRRQSK